ncbi:asparagine synthase [Halobacteriales archaeon QS_8_69_26]|nr:MAG: asparagine synthase [Halobacteriales archaeon QS_8_69_26]
MTGSDRSLVGADPSTVRAALDDGDPLPGTAGFAGRVDDVLVRDVLGRQPLFLPGGEPDGPVWSFDPTEVGDPRALPAGHAVPIGGSVDDARRVWTLPDPPPLPDRAAGVSALRGALGSVPVPDCPVAFSGGVDSGVVAALAAGRGPGGTGGGATGSGGSGEDAGSPLYVAGFPDSHDVAAARESAEAMGRGDDLRVVECTHESIREAAVAVARATGRTNAMDVAIAVPLYLAARRAAEDGHDRLLVGQAADELFGGYAKVARAPEDPRVEADTVRAARDEVLAGFPDQAARDVPAVRAAGVEPVAPFAHDRVVRAALELPAECLVAGNRRKVALRDVAAGFLPDVVAERDKKAVQYGTLVDRELDRLARQAGFKRRIGDHVSKYLASLVEE